MIFSVLRKPALYWALMFLLFSLLVTGYAVATPSPQNNPYPERNAELVIEPMGGPIKSKITMTGAGFAPGEDVDILLDIEGVTLKIGTRGQVSKANEFGAFQVTSTISTALETGGIYTIVARGEEGSYATCPLVVVEKK